MFLLFSLMFNRCFSTPPSCYIKFCFIRLFPQTQNMPEKDEQNIPEEIKVGGEVTSSGVRWKLPEKEMFHGTIVSKRKYRGVMRYKVKWKEDGVVETITSDQIRPMMSV